jgi:hypothetical protein
MNPTHLHSVSKTVYPRRADPLQPPPLKEHPGVEARSFHAALIEKWRLKFGLDLRRQKRVL